MLHHMATILVCYGGHFEPKMAAKIQKSSDLGEIWFPSRLWCCELISYLVVFALFLIMSPKRSFRRHIVFALFIIKSPNVVWRVIFLHRFLLLLSPQTKFGDLLFLLRFLLLLWTYVKIFDLTYIGNCQRHFHKTWYIY